MAKEWEAYCFDNAVQKKRNGIKIAREYIGLQIKFVSRLALDHYQWEKMHEVSHQKFKDKYGGKVFFVYCRKKDKKPQIDNPDVIDDIKTEIERLQSEENA